MKPLIVPKRPLTEKQKAVLARGQAASRARAAARKAAKQAQTTATPTPPAPEPAPPASDISTKQLGDLHTCVTLFVFLVCLLLAEELHPSQAEIDQTFLPLERILLRRVELAGISAINNPDLADALAAFVGALKYGIRVAPLIAARQAQLATQRQAAGQRTAPAPGVPGGLPGQYAGRAYPPGAQPPAAGQPGGPLRRPGPGAAGPASNGRGPVPSVQDILAGLSPGTGGIPGDGPALDYGVPDAAA